MSHLCFCEGGATSHESLQRLVAKLSYVVPRVNHINVHLRSYSSVTAVGARSMLLQSSSFVPRASKNPIHHDIHFPGSPWLRRVPRSTIATAEGGFMRPHPIVSKNHTTLQINLRTRGKIRTLFFFFSEPASMDRGTAASGSYPRSLDRTLNANVRGNLVYWIFRPVEYQTRPCTGLRPVCVLLGVLSRTGSA